MIVVDASAVLDVLLDLRPKADRIRERFEAEAPNLLAVHLIDAEVGQVLRRWVRAGEVGPARARSALDDLADLPIVRYPHLPLVHRAFELRDNATFYDALYVALAEATGSPLLTTDERLARVPGHSAPVVVV